MGKLPVNDFSKFYGNQEQNTPYLFITTQPVSMKNPTQLGQLSDKTNQSAQKLLLYALFIRGETIIPIVITYHPNTSELQLDCPSYRCKARTELIRNLQQEKIRFTNSGAILWVESRAFTSITDFTERAFRGFKEQPYRTLEDTSQTELAFSYAPVPCLKYHYTGITLFRELSPKRRLVSSKDLLDARYKERPSHPSRVGTNHEASTPTFVSIGSRRG